MFALIGELLKPKSFAGLFGAAPSVSLATLTLTVMKEGKAYASIEARSMILGSIAFIIYAAVDKPVDDASADAGSVSHDLRAGPVVGLRVGPVVCRVEVISEDQSRYGRLKKLQVV